MASDPGATPLIGRVAELRQLADLLGTTTGATNGSDTVLLGGDAGAGKSRLVIELGRQAVADGWRVMIGHCLDFGDRSPPYLPFTDALGRLAAQSPDLTASLVTGSPAIARLLPAHRMLTESEDAPEPTRRAALFEAVQETLSRLGQDQPLLLIIEDVHWADQSSRDLLRWLFTRDFGAPVALLVTYRSDDLHRRHPLRAALAEWVRLPGVARLQLDPLSPEESRQLIRALHPDTIEESDLHHILMRAEGNPFFIEELVAAAEVSGGLPADLADLLLVRLEQLGEDGRLVVRAAAVAGRRVSHPLLYRATELDDVVLDTGLRAAVDANILVAVGADGYAFRHALLAEAIYSDLLPGERVRLHAAYAAALASHGVEGSAAELSRHARASHDLVTATRASVQAGDEAMAVGGPEEALRHYELALELLSDPRVAGDVPGAEAPDGIDRLQLVISASMAAAAAGHLARSVSLAQAQLDTLSADAPPRDRARLIHAMVHTALVMDNNLDLLGLTTEAVRLITDEPVSPLRAQVLYIHARANSDRAREEDAARWATEALTIAREIGLLPIITDATLLLARLNERAGDPWAAQDAIESAIDGAVAAGAPFAELRGRYFLASLHYGQGRIDLARTLYAEAATRARALGRQWGPYGLDAIVFGAIATHVGGDWDLAAEMADMSGSSPPEIAAALFASIALAVAADRGDIAELRAMPAIRATWSLDGLIAITSASAAIELHAQAGDVDAAIAVHDDAVAHVTALWQRPSFHAQVRLATLLVGQLATAAATETTTARAALVSRGDSLISQVLAVAAEDRFSGPEGLAWVARARAERARLHWLAGIDAPPEAELVELWRDATAAFETFGHVYETARSRARLAAVLDAAGDTAAAATQAGLAKAVADRLGARSLIAELRGLAGSDGADGADTRGSRLRDADALTPREHDVLLQVATGRSNREIAQQLFISAKTVSVHISNVMAKLDAGSRTEAVAIARRKGLLD